MRDTGPTAKPSSAVRRRLPGRRTVAAFALGVALVSVPRVVLTYSRLADRLALPLLRPDTTGNAGAILVLGAAVDPFCTPNGPALWRTLLAARLYKAGRAPLVLFTGGRTYPDATCTVARVMADFAEELGVPADRVIIEDKSRDTWANAVNSAPLLRARGIERVLIVTDSIHMRRAEACFRSLGITTERASVAALQLYPDNLDLFRAVIHEYSGWWYYRWKGRIRGGDE